MGKICWIFLFFIIFLEPVLSITAGNNAVIETIDECYKYAFINVTGELPIIPGEYEFLNCTDKGNNSWDCPCDGSVNITIKTQIATFNSYNYTILYLKEPTDKEPTVIHRSSGGGSSGSGGGYYYGWNESDEEDIGKEDNQTEDSGKSPEQGIAKPPNNEEDSRQDQKEQEIIEKIRFRDNPFIVFFFILFSLIIMSLIGYLYYTEFLKKE